MKTSRQTGFFARMWVWFRGVFRPKLSPSKLLDGAVEEVTTPVVPPVVARRIDNSLLAPVRPRLKPSMVATTKLPSQDSEQTTRTPTPPASMSLSTPEREQSALEQPTPRKEAPRLLSLDDPQLVRPPSPKMSKIVLPTKAEKAMLEGVPTTQFQAPRQVAKKEKSPALSEVELAIESMPDGDEWEEPRNVVVVDSQAIPAPVLPADMAPPTLVQPRVQDSPELMELVEEFNARYGESES